MTEADWFKTTDSRAVLDWANRSACFGPRGLQLFAAACCRRIWHLLTDRRSRAAVEAAERFADGRIDDAALRAARDAAEQFATSSVPLPPAAFAAVTVADALEWRDGRWLALMTATNAAEAAADAEPDESRSAAVRYAERVAQCNLLRDIFGNPFRPVTLEPAWLDWGGGTVRLLAEAIYQEGRFDEVPVLADALEEAGCTDAQILDHCRKAPVHVRGCWAVDLLRWRG
jgi:hypothetical protein